MEDTKREAYAYSLALDSQTVASDVVANSAYQFDQDNISEQNQ